MGRLVFIWLFFMFVILDTHASVPLLFDSAVVAVVDGEEITQGELKIQSRSLRARVVNKYLREQRCDYGSNFWYTQYSGTTPMEVLKKKSLDTMVRIKVQQINARKAGIVTDISYHGFLNAMKAENTRRLAAKQAGRVIYGPVQYSEDVYYNYLFSNMVNNFKEYLTASVFMINDEKLKEAYERQKDSLFGRGYDTKVGLTAMTVITGENRVAGEKAMQEDTVMVFNDTLYVPEEYDQLRSLVMEATRNLTVGQSSRVILYHGHLYVANVVEKTWLGYRSFENCRAVLRKLLADRMYEEYVQNRVREATCIVNKENYLQIQF